MSVKVKLGGVLVTHPHLHELRSSASGGKPKASVMISVAKDDDTNIATLNSALATEMARLAVSNPAAKVFSPLQDGDGVRANGTPFSPEHHGRIVFNTSSERLPVVLDAQKGRITDPKAITTGDIVNVSLSCYGYRAPGRVGVSFEILGVQLVRKGEPFRGGAIEDDFSVLV